MVPFTWASLWNGLRTRRGVGHGGGVAFIRLVNGMVPCRWSGGDRPGDAVAALTFSRNVAYASGACGRPALPVAAAAIRAAIGILAGFAVAASAFGAEPQPVTPFQPVGFSALPGWPGDEPERALEPFVATCQALADRDAAQPLGGMGETARLGGRVAAYAHACAEAADLAADAEAGAKTSAAVPTIERRVPSAGLTERGQLVRAFFERRFRAFAVRDPGLLTGYFEPELRGAEYRIGAFQVPLYAALPPSSANGVSPMPDRAAIDAGALDGRGLEIAWVDDPVDAFFLQVQGSGRIRLHDGRVLRLGFAGRNGHPYRAIGRLLIDSGAVPRDRMSMQAIRRWLSEAPAADAAAALRYNPSYVFFRRLDGLPPDLGAPGALGAPLTPGRSLAVDPAFIPYGAPVFVATRDPLEGTPLRRLVHAQDTGTAIRGPARGDVFWGWGDAAAERAGRMREVAEMFVLVPREVERGDGPADSDAMPKRSARSRAAAANVLPQATPGP